MNCYSKDQPPPHSSVPMWRRWLAPAIITLTTVVIIGGILWLVRNDRPTAPLLATPSAASEPTYMGGPRISVNQDIFDYGDVRFGTPVKTVIKVKNVGDEALVLEREPWVELIEGCWPPYAVIGSMTLRPGEETESEIQFSMHQGMDGSHEFRVHILSNDPVEPDKQVTILSTWVP